MARIPYPAPEALDAQARRILQAAPSINVLRMLSHSGPLLGGFGAFGQQVLYGLELDPLLREMAIVRVGHLSNCAYELAQHERFTADLGVSAAKILALQVGAADPLFDQRERDVLAFVDDVVLNVRANDATLAAVARHLPPRQIVELIMVAGCYRMLCMMLETCGVDIESPGEVPQLTQAQWQSQMILDGSKQ